MERNGKGQEREWEGIRGLGRERGREWKRDRESDRERERERGRNRESDMSEKGDGKETEMQKGDAERRKWKLKGTGRAYARDMETER